MKLETGATLLLLGGGVVAGYLIYKKGGQFFDDVGKALSNITSGAGNVFNLPANIFEGYSNLVQFSNSPAQREARVAGGVLGGIDTTTKTSGGFTMDFIQSGGNYVWNKEGNTLSETTKTTITGTPLNVVFNERGEGMSIATFQGKPIYNAPQYPSVANILETPKLGFVLTQPDTLSSFGTTNKYIQTGLAPNTSKQTAQTGFSYAGSSWTPTPPKQTTTKPAYDLGVFSSNAIQKQYPYFNLSGGKK